MKAGITLEQLAETLERQRSEKRDFVVDTRKLQFQSGNGQPSHLLIEEKHRSTDHELTAYAERQISSHYQIPAAYWDRLRHAEDGRFRVLLTDTVNRHFEAAPAKRMVRAFHRESGNVARAFLSDRYRRLDNDTLAEVILPVLSDLPDVRIESCDVTERKLYIKALCPRIQADVKVGDPVQAGLVISNSEIGAGSLSISPLIYRLVCRNGMITTDATRRYHVGRRIEEGSLEIYADDTLKADDEAFWRVARDHVKAAVNETRFLTHVDKLREAAGEKILGDPAETVSLLQQELKLTDVERGGVLRFLVEGGDLSKYGLAQAVTQFSQDESVDYDRATELEASGGRIIDLPKERWKALATAKS